MSGQNKNRIRGRIWREENPNNIPPPESGVVLYEVTVRNRRRRKMLAVNGRAIGKGQKCLRRA